MQHVFIGFFLLSFDKKWKRVQSPNAPHRRWVMVFGVPVRVQSPIWATRFWRPVSMKKGKGQERVLYYGTDCVIYWTEEKQSKGRTTVHGVQSSKALKRRQGSRCRASEGTTQIWDKESIAAQVQQDNVLACPASGECTTGHNPRWPTVHGVSKFRERRRWSRVEERPTNLHKESQSSEALVQDV